jgi:prevent-host-death family protein
MEVGLREAKAKLSQLIVAVGRGERVTITNHGTPVAELIPTKRRGGLNFEKGEAARRRLGLLGPLPDLPDNFDDPAFSRRVLGLEE